MASLEDPMLCLENVNKMNYISAAVQRIAKPGFQVKLTLGNQVENSDFLDTSESIRCLVINLVS